MNTITRIVSILLLGLALCLTPQPASAQLNSVLQTSLSAAITATQTSFAVASATGINSATSSVPGSALYIVDTGQTEGELANVISITSTTVTVSRVRGGKAKAHASGALVYVATAPNWFYSVDPSGSCTLASTYVSPWLNTVTGQRWECSNVTGTWVRNNDYFHYVPPTQCTFAPTTLTTTNTFPQIGASTIFVLNGTTNAATGTLTLVCNIQLPSRANTGRGAVLKDITTWVGSQTTAPSAVGTATLGTITFPAAATSETASTVTPVAAGGTVTTTSPTQITTVTTAGAFLTIKSTFATAVSLATDLQLVQYTLPFTNGSAAAMTLNTPGLLVHYTAPAL